MKWIPLNCLALLAVVAALVIPVPANAQTGTEKAKLDSEALQTHRKIGVTAFTEANKLNKERKYDKATAKYMEALKKFIWVFEMRPMNAKNLYTLAKTYEKLGESQLAYLFYRKTLDANGQYVGDWDIPAKYLDAINGSLDHLRDNLEGKNFELRTIDTGLVGYQNVGCVLDLAEASGTDLGVPDQGLSLPIQWWFEPGTKEASFDCEGTRRTFAVVPPDHPPVVPRDPPGGGEPPINYPPQSETRKSGWKKSTTVIALVSGLVGGGLLGAGIGVWNSGANAMREAERQTDVTKYREGFEKANARSTWGYGLGGAGAGILMLGLGVTIWDILREAPQTQKMTFAPVYDGSNMGMQFQLSF